MSLVSPLLNSGMIGVDFYTSSYRIVGKVQVPISGFLGMINDPTTSFLEIQDARLARLHMPSKLVSHYEVIRLVKSQIFAVALLQREDLGKILAPQGGYSTVIEYSVNIISSVYELTGTLEWAGRLDFSAFKAEGSREFVPFYNCVLSAILIPAIRSECASVLFNRRLVDLFALNSQQIDS